MLVLRKGGHRDLERYYGLMEVDFDSEELIGKLAIHRALSKGEAELLIAYDDETKLEGAYALTVCRGLYGYVLLKYMAVFPWYRGHGLGVETMRLIHKRYADRQGLLAELTTFEDEKGEYLRKLRKFFARFGYVKIESDYRIGGSPVELMVKPLQGPWDVAPIAHRMIRDFYSRCLRFSSYERMIDIRPVKPEEKET